MATTVEIPTTIKVYLTVRSFVGQLIFWISILTSFKKVAAFIVVWFQKRPWRAHLYITKTNQTVKLAGGFDGIYVITAEDFGKNNDFNKITDFNIKSVTVVGQFINF